MNVGTISISDLDSSFANFVTAHTNNQANTEELARAFSDQLNLFAPHQHTTSNRPLVLSMQKRWARVYQELGYGPEKPTTKTAARIEKLTKQITQLSAEPTAAPRSKTAAEEISGLLSHDRASAVLHSLTQRVADQFVKQNPALAEFSKSMCKRIGQGEYGTRLQLQASHPQKSPLTRIDRFVKMLLVDLALHNPDSIHRCEWFARCPREELPLRWTHLSRQFFR